MANLAADLNYVESPRGSWSYKVTNALQVFKGSLLGIATSTGYVVKWADTAGHVFKGIAMGGATGNTSATPPVEVVIDERGVILRRVAVTGASAITDVLDKVYCTTDNPADLTKTATSNVGAIGHIVRWYSSTTCDVQLYTPQEFLMQ